LEFLSRYLVHGDHDEPEVHVRKNWQPVLAYDKGADLEFLQSFVHEHVPAIKRDVSALAGLLGAENSIRAEILAGTDSLFEERLAAVLRGL
jgi:hypothetical protein